MPKHKKEPAAAVTARFRARQTHKRRSQNEALFRNLLEKFYLDRGLEQPTWIEANEFFRERLEGFLDHDTFLSGIRNFQDQIEVGTASRDGVKTTVVRPRYFLSVAKEEK